MIEGTEIGAYRLLRRIGAGGMGEVWAAEHVSLGRRAAIKVLHPEMSARSDIVTRFFNEARAATAITDPGIVQVFEVGQHHDGSAYIVMELLDGEPLDARLSRLGTLPIGDALRLMRQVATSLGIAHACGIVHRDLKPENIFIVRDAEVASGERAKILDFGIAKLAGSGTGIKTLTSAVMGTPTFMSPEQCRGAGQVDHRSDLYSLGCVLFMLVTGRPPFEADGAGELIAMHLREPAPRASSRASGVPSALDAVIERCLAKDPAQRYATAGELARAIASIQPSGAALPLVEASVGPRPMPTTLSSTAMAVAGPRSEGRGRWMFGGLGIGLAAIAAVIAAMALHATPSEAPVAVEARPASPSVIAPRLDVLPAGAASLVGRVRLPLPQPPPLKPAPQPQPRPPSQRPLPRASAVHLGSDGMPTERSAD